MTNCLYKRNPASGFVGQHKFLCGLHHCDGNSVAHVMIGAHWCANICAKHLAYYSKRPDAQVSGELILDAETRQQARKGRKTTNEQRV